MALLSPVGISVHSGATSFEHHEAAVARAMAAQAKELILLADHSKVGQASRVTYASLSDVGTLVTDAGARALPAFSALQAAGCHIVVA
ncbi:Glucitol operon repressor [compost metagenome]